MQNTKKQNNRTIKIYMEFKEERIYNIQSIFNRIKYNFKHLP